MLDFVAIAMLFIVIILVISVWLVRRGQYQLHKSIQIVTAIILLIAVLMFEIDVRFFTDWRELAKPSPYYESGLVTALLYIHLCFAIPAPIVWGFVIARALKKFPKPPLPGSHSQSHTFWGWIAVILMVMTAATGWAFYVFAFVL